MHLSLEDICDEIRREMHGVPRNVGKPEMRSGCIYREDLEDAEMVFAIFLHCEVLEIVTLSVVGSGDPFLDQNASHRRDGRCETRGEGFLRRDAFSYLQPQMKHGVQTRAQVVVNS